MRPEPNALPEDVSELRQLVIETIKKLNATETRKEELEHQLALLTRGLYGRKSEKILKLYDVEDLARDKNDKARVAHRREKSPSRSSVPGSTRFARRSSREARWAGRSPMSSTNRTR